MVKNKFNTIRTLLFISIFFILNSILYIAHATIRYVSTTGSSTPPYTTWETAADSIQKCIDFSVDGDTIIVANGVYYESLIVDKYLWLIGSSMDSTIIDGTGLSNKTVDGQSDHRITNFTIIGKERVELSATVMAFSGYNVFINDCRIYQAGIGIFMGRSSGKIENIIISDCNNGIQTFCAQDTCHPGITNSIIIIESAGGFPTAIDIFDGGNPTISNNILIGDLGATYGIGISFFVKSMIIKNNIVSGFILNNI